MTHHGYPTHSRDVYRTYVGNGIAKLVERALPCHLRTPEYVETIRLEFVQYYQKHIYQYTEPYTGISLLLEHLDKKGVKIAVLSNKYQAGTEKLISHFFPNIIFSAVFGQRAGIPIKPAPDAVNEIISLSSVATEDVLYVGDSAVDMLTGKTANVDTVGVSWGFRSKEELENEHPMCVVDAPEQILSLV